MKILDLLNELPYNYFYLNVDEFLDLNLPQLKNLHTLSPKSLNITISAKNSGRLLEHPTTTEYIKNICKNNNNPVIIPFKPSAKIDLICRQQGYILASNPAKLNRLFEDKLKFPQICTDFSVPVIDYFIAPFKELSYLEAVSRFGNKLVIQTHFGWAGKSTHLCSSYNQAKQIIGQDTLVKFSPLLSGYSLLNNCCIVNNSLIQSLPAIQYTGIKPLTQNPFATVGRQWPSHAPQNIIDQVIRITKDFSKVLIKKKYQGFFGLDYIISKDKVYLLECNPRLTASFAFYTSLELKHEINPLFLFHIAEFLPEFFPIDIASENYHHQSSLVIGSEITRKDNFGTTIAKYSKPVAFSSTFDPPVIPQNIIDQLF